MARPFFARERVEDFENFEAYTARTLSILTSLSASDEAFDAQDLYARFTLDSASEFLFGKNLDTLSQPRPLAGRARMGPKGSALEGSWGSFAHSFETAQINVTTRARIGHWWPLLELSKDMNKEHAEVVHGWLDPLVADSLSDAGYSTRRSSKDLSGTSFLQYLAENTKGASNTSAPRLVADIEMDRSYHHSRSTTQHAPGFPRYGKDKQVLSQC